MLIRLLRIDHPAVRADDWRVHPPRTAHGQHVLHFIQVRRILISNLASYPKQVFDSPSYNSVNQAQLLLRDLKIAQYTKLAPRAAFFAQTVGTLLGAVLNFVLMNSIIDNQRDILLSVEGTNVWSGQQPQQYNSQAIAWGGLAHELFSSGKIYQWVPWAYVIGLVVPVPFWLVHQKWPRLRADYLYTPVIAYVHLLRLAPMDLINADDDF